MGATRAQIKSENSTSDEIREARHEGGSQATEVHAIVYFFGEYVSGIDLSHDMANLECIVPDPLMD